MNKIRIFLIPLIIVEVVQVGQRHRDFHNQTGLETSLQKKIEKNLVSAALRHFPVRQKKNRQQVEKSKNLN